MINIENKRPINRCQYWSLYDPAICKFWDATNTVCTFEEVTEINGVSVSKRADLYPYCNYIGTAGFLCKQYLTEAEQVPRCILPNPYRHLAIYPNNTIVQDNKKWVVPEKSEDGSLIPLDYSKITGYNSGKCNYIAGNDTTGGTDISCAGFTPHHMKFGSLEASKVEGSLPSSSILPFNHDILNKRSELGRCGRWASENYLFTVSEVYDEFGRVKINSPTFSCNDTTGLTANFADYFEDLENSYIRPPCNGAMPDCPRYTGNLASSNGFLPYISSIYLRNGDKVMAEQILEIRYNIQKENWNPVVYNEIFGEYAIIYANSGIAASVIYDENQMIQDYELPSIRVMIKNFDCFLIDRVQVKLTLGTPSENYKANFDTLIQSLKNLPILEPQIRSIFDTVYALDEELSYDQKRQYIFETTKTDHKKILLVGDYFYSKDVYAINISDPDILFPFNDLFEYGNMFMYKSKVSAEIFAERSALLAYYLLTLIDISPEKVFFNESSENDRCFFISVDTFFGENKIMVFDPSIRDYFTFDTITITKHFCGGLIAQTHFAITSSETTVSTNENYEAYSTFPRFSPEITYEFKALNSSTGTYTRPYMTYLDTVMSVPPANPLSFDGPPTVFLGYKLYKIKVMSRFIVSGCDTKPNSSRLIFLGNAGKVLVIIQDDLKLHAVIRKWDTGEVDENGNPKPIQLFLNGLDANGEEHSIEMEVLEYCTDRMELNQLLLKPKNFNEYVRLYSPVIDFKNGLYVYEKYSFGKEPKGTFEEVNSGYSEDTIIIRDASTLDEEELDKGTYTIRHLPTYPIVAAIVFKGELSGRVRGQVKSDLMIWVKQPFCSDVEIMYYWEANYQNFIVQPTGYCFIQDIGLTYKATTRIGYAPRCGDHSFGRISTRPAPMWYPYKQCDNYASYGIYFGSGENDPAPMEFWLNDVGRPIVGKTPYGAHNLRMLGPAEHYGITTDTHASIWACHCDYTHENFDMVGVPWFSGWARIRNGVEGEAYYYLVQNGGTPPKFGNKHRGYLLSYRSTAAIYYYKVTDGGSFSREKKWVPQHEAFSDIALDDSYKDYLWVHYFNTDDNTGTYVNQFGLILAHNTVNGIAINEKLEYEVAANTVLKRYRFSDIFKAHYTLTGTAYPTPKRQYSIGLSGKTVTAWLTYKDYEDTSKAIQWAWREIWKPLKRDIPNIRDILRKKDLSDHSSKDFHYSYLSFLDIDYTNYTYNFYLEEFRRIPEEGEHSINWIPSTYNKEAPLPTYFILKLDEGPLRIFNSKCELITNSSDIPSSVVFTGIDFDDIKKSVDFYKLCLEDHGDLWLNGKTSETDLETAVKTLNALVGGDSTFILYDQETIVVENIDEAEENATNGKRKIEFIRDDETIDLFFNRGLIVNVKQEMLRYLPKKDVLVEKDFEFMLSLPTHDESDFSKIDPLKYYPIDSMPGFNLFYSADLGDTSNLLIHFIYPLIVSKIEIVYKIGIEIDQNNSDIKNYYNKPDVVTAVSIDGSAGSYTYKVEGLYEFASENFLDVVKETYAFNVDDLDYMSNLYSFLLISFKFRPSAEDFEARNFTNSVYFKHFMHAQSIKIYTIEYLKLSEKVYVYERKFNISIGEYGTYPIHGFNNTGSLLYPEPATVYQYDTAYGMMGMPGSTGEFTSGGKTRDRHAAEIHPDNEVLGGTYTDFEAKQKELYDDMALVGEEEIHFISTFDKVYKDLLLGVKVNVLPHWSCKLENKAMVPLTPVKAEDSYYPPGHQWTWDRSSFQDFFNCGGGGVRQWRTIFAYKWGRVSQIYGYGYETDIFDLYSYGLSKTLTNWANSWMLAESWY